MAYELSSLGVLGELTLRYSNAIIMHTTKLMSQNDVLYIVTLVNFIREAWMNHKRHCDTVSGALK